MKHSTYGAFEHYISLRQYFHSSLNRRWNSGTGVAEALMLFHRLGRGESVYRRNGSKPEAVFPTGSIERFALLLESNSLASTIHQLYELTDTDVRERCVWDMYGADWKTFREARSAGYFDGCFAKAKLTNNATVKSVRSVLTYLQRSFALPQWQRIYLDDDSRTAVSQQEYPGWILRFAAQVHNAAELRREGQST